jgi:hypothetical protein
MGIGVMLKNLSVSLRLFLLVICISLVSVVVGFESPGSRILQGRCM